MFTKNDLQVLGQTTGQEYGGQKESQGRRETDDLRYITWVIHQENVPHAGTPIHEVVHIFHVMQDDEKHNEASDKCQIPHDKTFDDVQVVGQCETE